MKKNGVLDIIFKIISVLLCIVLVPTLIATVIVGTVSDIIRPETITKAVQSIDIQQVIAELPDVSQMLEEAEIEPIVVEKIVESNTVDQLFSTYVQDVSNYLVTGQTTFNIETIKNIINENRDEVQQILSEVAPEGVTVEDIEAELDAYIEEEIAPVINEALPDPQVILQDVSQKIIEVIKLFNSGAVTKSCIIACVILAVLILLLRLRECSFLIWHSVVAIVAGIFITLLYSGINMITSFLPSDLPVGQETIQSAISSLTQTMLISFIMLFVIAVLFITGFCVIRKIRNKKQQEVQEPQTA